MLELVNIGFDYPDKPLFQNVNFSVDTCQAMHLRGVNGAGKTTLLKIIAGIIHQDDGSIIYDGEPIENDLANYQSNICYVGHKTGITPTLTVAENCKYDLHFGRSHKNINELLDIFSMKDYKDTACNELSAGQRRRVGLLRLFMTDAPLWILDEPLVALDKDTISILMDCINNHLRANGLLIVTSHQPLPLNFCNVVEYWL